MADLTDADLDYLRNINTRPGPGVGQSIDPTKPGPTANRIAELAREIAELEAANETTPHWGAAVGARWEMIKGMRAELSRLRNEQPKGGDAILPGETFGSSKPYQPLTQGPGSECDRSGAATSPGPQDVPIDEIHRAWRNAPPEIKGQHPSQFKAFANGYRAALAQSDAPWKCQAIHSPTGANDPAECDWPFCGCDPSADRVIEALRERNAIACCDDSDDAIAAALAPVHHAAGQDYWRRSRAADAQSDAQPVGWQWRDTHGDWIHCHENEAKWRAAYYDVRPLYAAPHSPDASGLIEALANDLGFAEWATPEHAEEILRELIAKYHGPLRARAAT